MLRNHVEVAGISTWTMQLLHSYSTHWLATSSFCSDCGYWQYHYLRSLFILLSLCLPPGVAPISNTKLSLGTLSWRLEIQGEGVMWWWSQALICRLGLCVQDPRFKPNQSSTYTAIHCDDLDCEMGTCIYNNQCSYARHYVEQSYISGYP